MTPGCGEIERRAPCTALPCTPQSVLFSSQNLRIGAGVLGFTSKEEKLEKRLTFILFFLKTRSSIVSLTNLQLLASSHPPASSRDVGTGYRIPPELRLNVKNCHLIKDISEP